MPLDKPAIAARFTARFQQPPQYVVRAPGRVNLIGEHTDYNDGFVMPLAIDRAVWIALRPRTDGRVLVHSIDYNESAEFALDGLNNQKAETGTGAEPLWKRARTAAGEAIVPVSVHWIEYIKGIAWSLQDAGHRLTGWEGVMAGDVPPGAGLSSSAALEMAAARAFAAVSNLPWEPAAMAKLGQRAENKWVGVNCGIMDQLISACGRAEHALLIDCRSLECRPEPFPPGVAVVVLDTVTRRGLVDSAYNQRRSQCEAAAKFFGVKALRDVDRAMFDAAAAKLDPTTRRRALHVITENDRTVRAGEAMRRGDLAELGKLMNESHVSLRDDYEVSSDALNAMVECAQAHAACYGARMTGAGFGGCAVAVIRAAAADDFAARTSAAYQQKTGHQPAVYVCRATDGAGVV